MYGVCTESLNDLTSKNSTKVEINLHGAVVENGMDMT